MSSTDAYSIISDLKNYIDSKINSIEVCRRGIVTEIMKDGKSVRVKPLPQNPNNKDKGHIMPYVMPIAGDGVQIGCMPPTGSEVLILFESLNADYKWNTCVALGGIFNTKTNISPDRTDVSDDAKKDKQHFVLQPKKNGSKLEIHDNLVRISATKDFKEDVKGKKVITVDGGSDSKIIHLGEDNIGDDNYLVTAKHLDLYDQLVDALDSYSTNWNSVTSIGDMGIPLPFVARGVTYFPSAVTPLKTILATIKENRKNITTKVKAK